MHKHSGPKSAFIQRCNETNAKSGHCLGQPYVIALLDSNMAHISREPSVGNLVVFLGVDMDAGLAWGSVGTNEPDLARTSCCSLGRIVSRY